VMTDLVPTQASGSKGVTITQFDLISLEHLGLVKIDLLGIRGLTVLRDVADGIRAQPQVNVTSRLALLDSIPLDEPQTSERLQNGQTIGCFQIESPGMRSTLREIGAANIDDLMVALALYRPGPIKGGYRDAFIRRHKGTETVAYLHPNLAPVLQETYGVILYQEQVLRIAHDLAGLSIAESDLLRRAMSHFDPGKQMDALKERFVRGALEVSQVAPETAGQIWELMAAFAGYGFPKAHAASYALVAWKSAWCKTHFPAEFMAAVLANWGGYYSQRVYLTEARRMNLKIHPPHVNYSRGEFSVFRSEGIPHVYMGLDQVRELTHRTQERIIQGRPFHSLGDFLMKVDPRPLEAENLVKVGALAGLGVIPELLRELKEKSWSSGQLSLFDKIGVETEDWSLSKKVNAQQEILGIGVDAQPLELVTDQIKAAGTRSTVEAAGMVGKKVRLAGTRQSWHRTFTVKGETMAYMTLEDLDGEIDVVVPANVYRLCKNLLFETFPLFVEGIVEIGPSRIEPLLRAEKIFKIPIGNP
jgi:DNA polymerase III subunit alpha